MDKNKHDLKKQWLSVQHSESPAVLECDTEKYSEHLDEPDLSEERQAEMLQTLWSIMAAFVDLGFGVDSVQIIQKDASPSAERNAEEELTLIIDPKVLKGSSVVKEIDHE